MISLVLAAQILVGVTGYDQSPELREIMTNDECNLFVQWEKSGNLLPGNGADDEWIAWAKKNGVHVMTIYGDQDAPRTRELREFWGDLYLGNNVGEYAGFLYQDENSFSKSWPLCKDLKEARDWLVKEMLAAPARTQLSRPADSREPCLYSTSGSPLGAYELKGGFGEMCNEMYAVGCANLAYATAESRGAARRYGRRQWSAWLAHEWQTCWPRVPYSVPQKFDSLEVGFKELWVMGTSMMVLESGSQTTQAQDYTPPDAAMTSFKTEKQEYEGAIPKAYRRTLRDFYQWTKAHPRAEGEPKTECALVLGNCDGYVGMSYDTFAIFGQHHLAKTNSNWRCGAPEASWDALKNAFFPVPTDSLKPYANSWLGGTPYGQLDVTSVDDDVKVADLRRYKVLIFGGWNTMTPSIASVLRDYVASGGEVVLCVPQLSGRIDREYTSYAAKDLIDVIPGVKVCDPKTIEDIMIIGENAPSFLREHFPAHRPVKLRVANVELGDNVDVEATLGREPYLIRARHGKGLFHLILAWGYPAAWPSVGEQAGDRELRLDFWKAFATGLVESRSSDRIRGVDRDYVNWSVIGDRVYFLNTDCTQVRSIEYNGRLMTFAPKELRELVK